MLYVSYIIIDTFTAAYALIILLRLSSRMAAVREKQVLRAMLIIYIISNITDSICSLSDGHLVSMSSSLYAFIFLLSILPVIAGCYFWYVFIDIRLCPNKKVSRREAFLTALPAAFLCILNILSVFTGWIFYVSQDSTLPYSGLTYGPLFPLHTAIAQAYVWIPVLRTALAAARTSSSKERNEYIGYIICMGLTIAASFIEDYLPGIPVLSMCIFLVIQILFLTIYLDQQQKLAAEEKELMESRMSIMLSQIQPHFLYNSLECIQDMCHDKAPEAEKATIEFARFLRGNLDSLTIRSPISFRKELQHTQNYLALEINRFGEDKLHVRFDLQAMDFRIPALSLQPLVENAVRHGVMQKMEGGTVCIQSEETRDAFRIRITDDGVGFDPSSPPDDSRSHVGIINVRNRLETMCGGTLSISSVPGKGTESIIQIPKEWMRNEDTDRR